MNEGQTDSAAEYAPRANVLFQDRGTDSTVVLLHGLGGDHRQPLGLSSDAFSSSGLSVLAPDARAHGDTHLVGPASCFSTESLAADLMALVRRLGLDDKRLILVGISMGAAVALHTARHYPAHVGGVVLIRPSFDSKPWPDHLLVFREIAELLRKHGAAGADALVRSPSYQQVHSASPSAAASLLEQFTKPYAVDRVVRLETVPGNVALDWEGELDLGCPTTVVGAEKDPGHPVAVAELWHQALASSTLQTVPSRDDFPDEYASSLERIVSAALTSAT